LSGSSIARIGLTGRFRPHRHTYGVVTVAVEIVTETPSPTVKETAIATVEIDPRH
jgi:hypothetical protein